MKEEQRVEEIVKSLGDTVGELRVEDPILSISNLDFFYGQRQALFDVNFDIGRNEVLSLIGTSGSGKTTLLNCLLSNLKPTETRLSGEIFFDGENIWSEGYAQNNGNRKNIVYVSQEPTIFPLSIFENIAVPITYWSEVLGSVASRNEISNTVKKALEIVGLYEEVRYRLEDDPEILSTGQKQRLCVARALAIEPKVLLLDEPAAHLDPFNMNRLEEAVDEMRNDLSIVIVSHNLSQAARTSQRTLFMNYGKVVEGGDTDTIFTNPRHELTENFITGGFG